jgi:prolyl oligopeptidase
MTKRDAPIALSLPRFAIARIILALGTSTPFVLLADTSIPAAAPIHNVTNDYFGVKVTDPYGWMEDWKSAEFQRWLKSENEFARSTLDAIPARKGLLAELRSLDSSLDTFPAALNRVGDHFFYMLTPPPSDVFQLYMREGEKGHERLIFNPRAPGSPFGSGLSLDLYHAAPDSKHAVCRLSRGGAEDTTIIVVDVDTGQIVGPGIEHAQFGNSSWHPNGGSFFYSRSPLPGEPGFMDASGKRRRIYLHSLGTEPQMDRVVFGPGVSTNVPLTEGQTGSFQTSWDSDFVAAVVRKGVSRECEIYLAPLPSIEAGEIPWRKVCSFSDEVVGCILHGGLLLLSSQKNAPHGKLLQVSSENPDLTRAVTIVPETRGVLDAVASTRDGVYYTLREGIAQRLFRVDARGERQEIQLPVLGSIDRIIHDPRESGVILPLTSWTEQTAYFCLDPKTLTFARFMGTGAKVSGAVRLHAQQVTVRSKDGTLVPLTIISREGLVRDHQRPTLLEGYGAYGISQTPNFDLARTPWFAAGGVYAVAHVRGGGELGEEWRLAGKGTNKQNGIDDFIACAEYLVEASYTSPAKLAAKGVSAGGVLVGRALTERPDLFRAVILEVGALDALRFEATRNGEPNVPEWGSVRTKQGFEALRNMSPYEHVLPGTPYPAVLLTAGFNDPRVDVWQPAKMAARMRAATSSALPVLLAVNYDEGHFHSTISSFNEHNADIWSFLFWQLGELK